MIVKREASILVVALIIINISSLLVLGWWCRVSMSYDIILTREQYYKDFYVAEFVLFHCLTDIKKNFSRFFRQSSFSSTPFFFEVSDIAKRFYSNHTHISARCSLEKWLGSQALRVGIVLYRDEKAVCSIRCDLVQKQKKVFIKHYTLGIFV